MAIQVANYKTIGMQRDTSESAFDSRFAFENMNMRITAKDSNTFLSLTNEKGTQLMTTTGVASIPGYPIGYCVMNDTLVLFTTMNVTDGSDAGYDTIYSITNTSTLNTLLVTQLFQGDLDFDVTHPIETIPFYENEDIQKVYWTDGKNQPRFINITAVSPTYTKDSFDFIQSMSLDEGVTITKNTNSTGVFPIGTVQYVFTYFNRNGVETAPFFISSLYYTSKENRGGSAEDTSNNSFNIEITNSQTNFNYIRIYSIIRTSIDSTPVVKKVRDITTSNSVVTLIDTNTTGESQTSTSLLYKGGNKVIAQTITQKDNVLFLGNVELSVPVIGENTYWGTTLEDRVKTGVIHFTPKELYTEVGKDVSYPYIPHTLIDGQRASTSFKGGEYYRFGVQFQHESGQWSEVLFVKDIQNTLYPTTTPTFGIAYDGYPIQQVTVSGVMATMDILTTEWVNAGISADLVSKGYKKVRGVVVYPKIYERRVIAQGFLNPTLFNVDDRYNNSPSNINSWFLRPMSVNTSIDSSQYTTYLTGNTAEFRHNKPLPRYDKANGEVQSADRTPLSPFINPLDFNIENGSAFKNYFGGQFFVDQSVLTFNSPELEFDAGIQALNNTELNLQIIGLSHLTGFEADVDLTTSTGPFHTGGGFIKPQEIGVKNYSGTSGINAMIAAHLWYDQARAVAGSGRGVFFNFKVYPWHSERSLIDDDGTHALLSRKNMSNVRYSGFNTYLTTPWTPAYGIAPVSIITDSEDTIHKITNIDNYYESDLIYKGTIDKIVTPDSSYLIMGVDCGSTWDISNANYEGVSSSINNTAITSSVNIKYKTNSHAVIAFNWKDAGTQIVAPRLNGFNTSTNAIGGKPFWNDDLSMTVEQDSIYVYTRGIDTPYGGVWLAELYRDINTSTIFGGSNKSAYTNNDWYIAGETMDINDLNLSQIPFTNGDTFVQRYDCLRVYPSSIDDFQTMTEIVSVLCETKINLDGRYDNNRNSSNNLAMTPNNFNLLNPIYDQKDNYYLYHALDYDLMSLNKFSNTFTWTPKKIAGELTDSWTNIDMINTYDANGKYGPITALRAFNNELVGFQNKGLFKILYNSRVQVNASDGFPIEFANSGSVDGIRYITSNIGTTNKYSIVETPNGLYFIDDINKSINLISDQVTNLSDKLGFRSWSKTNFTGLLPWNPIDYQNFTGHYDSINKDVYFVGEKTALCFSELIGQFTSFFNYEKTPYIVNMWDGLFSIRKGATYIQLWKHNAGVYNRFYGASKPFYTTIISNQNPTLNKVFNTLEFRADSWDNTPIDGTRTLQRIVNFNKLNVWNEYQIGDSDLINDNGRPSTLKSKFRAWRIPIPRVTSINYDSVTSPYQNSGGLPNPSYHAGLDRLRGNWAYLQLWSAGVNNLETTLHDINVYYNV